MTKLSQYEKPGPDKGFAWVVALSCFFINFIMAGLARSAGVLYVALIELYGVSRESATTPFSIRVCVRNMTGPLVGMLGQRYGIRIVTICGGVFAAVGGMLCYFAPDVFWITIFWGGIHGIGFGLSTVLHMVAVNQYFDKYRATALGLSYSGDSIGTMVLPVVFDALILDLGIKGTFLVIGGIVLNVIPLAMLLRPPPWLNTSKVKSVSEDEVHCKQNKSYDNSAYTGSQILLNESMNSKIIGNPNQGSNMTDNEIPSYEEAIKSTSNLSDKQINSGIIDAIANKSCTVAPQLTINANTCDSCSAKPKTNTTASEILNQEGNTIEQINGENTSGLVSNFMNDYGEATTVADQITVSEIGNVSIHKKADGITEIVMESRDLNHNNVVKTTITEHCENNNDTVLRIRTLSESRRLGVKHNGNRSVSSVDKVYNKNQEKNFTADIEPAPIEVCQEVKFRKGNVEVIQNPISSSIIISYDDNDNSRQNTAESNAATNALESSGSFKMEENKMSVVLRNTIKANLKPMFVLISVTAAVYIYLFIALTTVIIDFGEDKGISREDGKYFIVGYSITDLVGRLGFGVIMDRNWIDIKYYVAMTVGIMGSVVTLVPFCPGFLTILTVMCSFGFIQGGVAIMFPILVNKYMEKDEESIAMGCLNFYGGLFMLSMAPMIGFFRDKYGTYDNMFRLVGSTCVAVGLVWILEPFIVKCGNSPKVTKGSTKQSVHATEVMSIESDA